MDGHDEKEVARATWCKLAGAICSLLAGAILFSLWAWLARGLGCTCVAWLHLSDAGKTYYCFRFDTGWCFVCYRGWCGFLSNLFKLRGFVQIVALSLQNFVLFCRSDAGSLMFRQQG
ncbi:unnamed protein product [Trifolium pratense]|uniref:Uncharacterized protein n=1 Tax=Trifolium pratense TaxID=57577 RepID=A0ACB0JN30_TRIPR|nr:unnamed protein product [Trifolium pratense]